MKKYIIYSVVATICAALCFLLRIDEKDVSLCHFILTSIVPILASGVFGSMLATIFIEKTNDKLKREDLKAQRNILLADVVSCVGDFIKQEFECMNRCIAIYLKINNKSSMKKQKYVFEEAIEKIKIYCEFLLTKANMLSLFDSKENQREADFDEYFYKKTRSYCINLKLYLERIISFKEYHMISKVLSENDIQCLRELFVAVEDLLNNIEENENENFWLVLDFKYLLCEKIEQLYNHFSLKNKYNSLTSEVNIYEIDKEKNN